MRAGFLLRAICRLSHPSNTGALSPGVQSLTAFVAFIRAYGVWIYLLCALGILFGIKSLADARRLARTTLFSLEQERAGEQTYRAIILILVLVLTMGMVAMVNAFLGSSFQGQEQAAIVRGSTPTAPALIFPTNTLNPTATPTLRPTETVFAPNTPVSMTPTRVKSTAPPPSPTGSSAPPLPAPVITGPGKSGTEYVVTGENRMYNDLIFRWSWECDQCILGPSDAFVVVFSYTEKSSGKPVTLSTGPVKDNFLRMADIVRGGMEIYQRARDDRYQWHVLVKRADVPLTPASASWSFVWH